MRVCPVTLSAAKGGQMRRNEYTMQGGHGLTEKAERMDPRPHSDQATAAPGGPGRPSQAGARKIFGPTER